MVDQFVEHAALILRQDKVTVGEARWTAWLEGPEGYKKRQEKEKEEARDED